MTSSFRCPHCLGELTGRVGALACSSCARSYPERDGIADFRWQRRDYYFNPVPREEMSRLIEDAASVAWEETVRRFVRFVKNVPDWIDNVAVNGRYAWKLFLELPPGARMLDFGCGLGNLSQNIAPHVDETVALDLTWERLRFARERFAKFNAADRIVLVAAGDAPHLPFPDAHFDCVALSGVLEWIADDDASYRTARSRPAKVALMLMSFFGEANPRRTQLRFLRELRRILKPDGQLFVGIENRWGYEYFVGRPDHHSGLPLGSLLPRFIANAYSIARSHRPYRTYTHSYRGMRRLFADAGMSRCELYGLTPGYSRLGEIVPADTDQPFWDAEILGNAEDRLKRSRYFVPAFGMIAQPRNERRLPLVGRLLAHIASESGLGTLRLRRCVVSGKDKVILKVHDGERQLVVKLPADAASQAGEATNARILEALERRDVRSAPTPRFVTSGQFQGLTFYVEECVPGLPLSRAAAIDRAAMAAKVARLIRAFAEDPARSSTSNRNVTLHERMANACAKLREAGVARESCDNLSRRAGEALGWTWRFGLSHGDLSVRNIFVANGEISGVIDWEYADEHGIPALDLIGYLESRQRLEDPASNVSMNLTRLARREWPRREELAVLHAFYSDFGIDDAQHEDLCALAWLSHMQHQLDGLARYDPHFAERLMVPQFAMIASAIRPARSHVVG